MQSKVQREGKEKPVKVLMWASTYCVFVYLCTSVTGSCRGAQSQLRQASSPPPPPSSAQLRSVRSQNSETADLITSYVTAQQMLSVTARSPSAAASLKDPDGCPQELLRHMKPLCGEFT